MKWVFLASGVIVGALFGVAIMCLCFVSGEASRMEERASENKKTTTEKENVNYE